MYNDITTYITILMCLRIGTLVDWCRHKIQQLVRPDIHDYAGATHACPDRLHCLHIDHSHQAFFFQFECSLPSE